MTTQTTEARAIANDFEDTRLQLWLLRRNLDQHKASRRLSLAMTAMEQAEFQLNIEIYNHGGAEHNRGWAHS